MPEDRTVDIRSLTTTVLEVLAGAAWLAGGWLVAGLGGLLLAAAVVLVLVSWLLERR